MLTTRQKADYLMQVVKLRKLMILKDNPAFTYQHSNRKQAISRVHGLQDKIVEAAVDNQVYGNSDSVNHQKTVEQTISDALENDRKRVYKADDNRYINTAVKLNTEKYSEILNNRLNIESVKLEAKIEEEIRKSKYNGLSEAEIKKRLTSEFGDTAKLRTANIIRDALHTNEVNIGFIHALQNGFQYKVWNNGRGKGKVRAWHRARFISSVPIDEPFDIFGSYHAEMMYPGDLNGGAENVANCRCWLSYTNQKPSNFRSSGSSRSSSSKQTKNTKKNTSNKNKFSKDKLENTQFKRDLSKSVTVDNKIAYGVGESLKDKIAFQNKYGIKYKELTSDEIKFIKLYSGDGFSIINNYLRVIGKTRNPYKRWKYKKKYSKEWDELFVDNKYYLSFDKMIKTSKGLFNKGKVLENDLVVVRKQWKPLTEYADDGVYNNEGYLSTSISKNVEGYGDYIHHIRIPAGEKIIYIEGVTAAQGEFEIIIPPKKRIKFVKQVSPKLQEWTL